MIPSKNSVRNLLSDYGLTNLADAFARARMPVSPQAVYKWAQRGCVPLKRLETAAKILGVEASALNPTIAKLNLSFKANKGNKGEAD